MKIYLTRSADPQLRPFKHAERAERRPLSRVLVHAPNRSNCADWARPIERAITAGRPSSADSRNERGVSGRAQNNHLPKISSMYAGNLVPTTATTSA